MRAEAPFGEVLAVVRELAGESSGEITGYGLYHQAAARLDIDVSQRSPALRQSWRRFISQVGRALKPLDGEGVLIKVGAGAQGPDARAVPRVRWYTPAGWKTAAERARIQHQEEAEVQLRWAGVRGALARAGITPLTSRDGPVQLNLDEWEQLLTAVARR